MTLAEIAENSRRFRLEMAAKWRALEAESREAGCYPLAERCRRLAEECEWLPVEQWGRSA